MGQLERYGLYVLVLVIFLILGVAIWGSDPQTASAAGPGAGQLDVRTRLTEGTLGGGEGRADEPVEDPVSRALSGSFEIEELEDLGTAAVAAPEVTPPTPGPEASPEPRKTEVRDEPPPLRDYKIREGDTLWEIAGRELGSHAESEQQRIRALNPGLDPKLLPVGRTIKLPPPARLLAEIRAEKAPGAGGKIYVVQKGDNPSTIAERLLGHQKYASAILKANGIDEEGAKRLREGTELVIPRVEKD